MHRFPEIRFGNQSGFRTEIIKECGTSEALKLKLHLNSEVYKGDLYNDFG